VDGRNAVGQRIRMGNEIECRTNALLSMPRLGPVLSFPSSMKIYYNPDQPIHRMHRMCVRTIRIT
jgi:hypothetical protein